MPGKTREVNEMGPDTKTLKALLARSLSARLFKRITLMVIAAAFSTMFALAISATQNESARPNGQQASPPDWKAVEQALGKAGSMQPGDVYKVSLPRSDLKVTVGGVELKPALALGSWVAFKKSGDMTMIMGDLVLTEDEVTPVLTKLQEGGVEVTALHNHVLHESPRVMYMHIHAMGDGEKVAKAIHDALALSKTPFTAPPVPAQTPDVGLDTRQIDQIMGQAGK